MLRSLLVLPLLLVTSFASAGIISDLDKTQAQSDGWSIVYQGGYAATFDMASIMNSFADGTTFALASSSSNGASTYDLFGSTSQNLLDIRGTTKNSTTFADGAHWYWNNYGGSNGNEYGSLGFSDSAAISQSSADTMAGDKRLSWHTGYGMDNVRFGWRSGNNRSLNGSNVWQRYVLVQAPIAAVPEPSVVALMGLGIFGLALSRRKMKK